MYPGRDTEKNANRIFNNSGVRYGKKRRAAGGWGRASGRARAHPRSLWAGRPPHIPGGPWNTPPLSAVLSNQTKCEPEPPGSPLPPTTRVPWLTSPNRPVFAQPASPGDESFSSGVCWGFLGMGGGHCLRCLARRRASRFAVWAALASAGPALTLSAGTHGPGTQVRTLAAHCPPAGSPGTDLLQYHDLVPSYPISPDGDATLTLFPPAHITINGAAPTPPFPPPRLLDHVCPPLDPKATSDSSHSWKRQNRRSAPRPERRLHVRWLLSGAPWPRLRPRGP